MTHWTVTCPSLASGTTALLARVRPAVKFTVLVTGADGPPGCSRKYPGSPGFTAVTLKATARASAGMLHAPATGKGRLLLAASAGPPEGPAGSRVSATRHGGIV